MAEGIEGKMDALIAALKENTAAHLGKAATAGTAGKATTAAAPKTKPAVDFETVKTSAYALRDFKPGGKEEVQKLIKTVGKAGSLADVKEPNYAALLLACDKKLEELEAAAAAEPEASSEEDEGI